MAIEKATAHIEKAKDILLMKAAKLLRALALALLPPEDDLELVLEDQSVSSTSLKFADEYASLSRTTSAPPHACVCMFCAHAGK